MVLPMRLRTFQEAIMCGVAASVSAGMRQSEHKQCRLFQNSWQLNSDTKGNWPQPKRHCDVFTCAVTFLPVMAVEARAIQYSRAHGLMINQEGSVAVGKLPHAK